MGTAIALPASRPMQRPDFTGVMSSGLNPISRNCSAGVSRLRWLVSQNPAALLLVSVGLKSW